MNTTHIVLNILFAVLAVGALAFGGRRRGENRRLAAARFAPRRPEVDHDAVAVQVGEGELVPGGGTAQTTRPETDARRDHVHAHIGNLWFTVRFRRLRDA